MAQGKSKINPKDYKEVMGKKMPRTKSGGKPVCPPGQQLKIGKDGSSSCVAKPGKRDWLKKQGDRKVAKPPKK